MVSGFLFGETSNIRDRGINRLPEWFFSTDSLSADNISGIFIKNSFLSGLSRGNVLDLEKFRVAPGPDWLRCVNVYNKGVGFKGYTGCKSKMAGYTLSHRTLRNIYLGAIFLWIVWNFWFLNCPVSHTRFLMMRGVAGRATRVRAG
jgi:hypothetical protein